MTLLEDVRRRLIWFAAVLFVVFFVALWFSREIFAWLSAPLLSSLEEGSSLIGTGLAEAFLVRLKASLTAALFAASPAFFYQLWQVACPVLGVRRRGYAIPFVLAASFFFLAGGFFCHQVVFPTAFFYLIGQFKTIGAHPEIRASEYFSFSFRMMVGFGVTFELPVISFFLARLGLVTHSQLWGRFRIAVLLIFVLAAVLTPGPDVLSQLLLAAPLCFLYGLSILIAYLAHPRKN